MKILIADDHHLLRCGIRSILEEMPEIESVSEASNGNEAIKATREQDFDLLLLDISMPGKDGLDTLKQLRYENPDIRILMLTMHPEDRYAIRTLKSGASGYLKKDCSPEELKKAVREVMATGKYISPSLAFTLAQSIDATSAKSPQELLSDRELQVMRLLASARTLNEIAEELNISAKTVTTYKGRILEKLNLRNSAELIRYAIENDLL
ncbi:MAG: response regulator transcription factor [Thermodesulfovibrionales bacterium]|nr:response regulator transcription factor [Thermodesulfovibrionales bacterium]